MDEDKAEMQAVGEVKLVRRLGTPKNRVRVVCSCGEEFEEPSSFCETTCPRCGIVVREPDILALERYAEAKAESCAIVHHPAQRTYSAELSVRCCCGLFKKWRLDLLFLNWCVNYTMNGNSLFK